MSFDLQNDKALAEIIAVDGLWTLMRNTSTSVEGAAPPAVRRQRMRQRVNS